MNIDFKITNVISYIDTIIAALVLPYTKEAWLQLCASAGSVKPDPRMYPGKGGLLQNVTIHQPSDRTFELLSNIKGYVWSVHPAIDFIVSPGDHDNASAYFKRHTIQKYHGKRETKWVGETMYLSYNRATNKNFVIYSDRPSKVTGERCIHLEPRFRRARTLKRYDLDQPQKLGEIDVLALLKRQATLKVIDPKRFHKELTKIILKRFKPKVGLKGGPYLDQFHTVDGLARRLGGFLLRYFDSYQEMVEFYPTLGRALVPLKWESIIGVDHIQYSPLESTSWSENEQSGQCISSVYSTS
jgi:hypothetical protein